MLFALLPIKGIEHPVHHQSFHPRRRTLMTRIAIVGSREYAATEKIEQFVWNLRPDTVIVSGGDRGVDRTAEQAARRRGLRTLIFRAEWTKYGKRAGSMRNELIVDNADEVVAFWDGWSPGTADTIRRARAARKPVRIMYSTQQPILHAAAA
jgi:hypothetical protein